MRGQCCYCASGATPISRHGPKDETDPAELEAKARRLEEETKIQKDREQQEQEEKKKGEEMQREQARNAAEERAKNEKAQAAERVGVNASASEILKPSVGSTVALPSEGSSAEDAKRTFER